MCSILFTQELYVNPGVIYDEVLIRLVFAVTSFLDAERLLFTTLCYGRVFCTTILVVFVFYSDSVTRLCSSHFQPTVAG